MNINLTDFGIGGNLTQAFREEADYKSYSWKVSNSAEKANTGKKGKRWVSSVFITVWLLLCLLRPMCVSRLDKQVLLHNIRKYLSVLIQQIVVWLISSQTVIKVYVYLNLFDVYIYMTLFWCIEVEKLRSKRHWIDVYKISFWKVSSGRDSVT
jgi:predicted neutral ceramidase superfamily lipid hydrolase